MPSRDTPLPTAANDDRLAFVERTDLVGGRYELVYKAPLEGFAKRPPKPRSAFSTPVPAAPSGSKTTAEAASGLEDDDALEEDDKAGEADEEEEAPARAPTPLPPSQSGKTITKRRRLIPQRVKRVMPLLLQEFQELDQYDEREMLYGDERATLLLPKIRLDRKKKAVTTHKGKGLAAYPELKRVLPRLISYETAYMEGYRRYVFEGTRPDAIHVLTRVLETTYKFRLEDLSHYVTHGDLVLRALERLDCPTQVFDLGAIVYCPSVDSHYPFKFLLCGESSGDNYMSYTEGLRGLLEKVEKVDTFRERVFGELKLGFEKFGPGCATPEFQEVELRLWKLLGDAGQKVASAVAELLTSMKGDTIRRTLKTLHDVHEAIDACQHLPSTLCAYYRHHFDLPFGKIFEHALAAVDEIAKKIGVDLRDARPKNVDELAQIISTIRAIPPRSPLENLEARDAALAACYKGKGPPMQAASPEWVRRYTDTIFTGTDRFDIRRFKKGEAKEDKGSDVVIPEAAWDIGLEEPAEPKKPGKPPR
jgi:hypothetical protein